VGRHRAARTDGEPDEKLAPRRLGDTTSYERPLPAADLVAEPAALEEIEAVANQVA
jgi:hypothetical protein